MAQLINHGLTSWELAEYVYTLGMEGNAARKSNAVGIVMRMIEEYTQKKVAEALAKEDE